MRHLSQGEETHSQCLFELAAVAFFRPAQSLAMATVGCVSPGQKRNKSIPRNAPWRLIRKKPNGALILVHEDNFPINYSSNILCHKLLVAMPTITSLALEAMRLHPEDIIIHYLNAKCTFIIPKHGSSKESIYYNKPYNFIVDGPISMQDYWHNISTLHTLEDILTMTLGMLIAQVNHVNWEE